MRLRPSDAISQSEGGTLVGLLSWRWAFLINVPFAVVILALTPFVLPATRSPERMRLDVPGAALVTLGLLALVFGIIERFLPALIAAAILLVLIIFSMEAGLIFLMTLYLQDVLLIPSRLSPPKDGAQSQHVPRTKRPVKGSSTPPPG